jgi:hypothetical protein
MGPSWGRTEHSDNDIARHKPFRDGDHGSDGTPMEQNEREKINLRQSRCRSSAPQHLKFDDRFGRLETADAIVMSFGSEVFL